MTAADEYGDDTIGGIILCTHVTGAAGSETPDTANGETLYLVCAKLKGKLGFLQKIKETANDNAFAARDGKKGREVSLEDCVVFKWTNSGHVSVATNTAAFNAICDWLDSKHDAGDAPFYLFAYNFVDSTYLKLTPNQYRYLKGYVTVIDWEIANGNIYYFKTLNWKWVK